MHDTDEKRIRVQKTIQELRNMQFSINGLTIDDIIEVVGEIPETKERKVQINEVLAELGMYETNEAYDLMVFAIEFLLDNKGSNEIKSVRSEVYPEIAKRYSISERKVSVNIGREIANAWRRMDMEAKQRYFGNPYQKPNARRYIEAAVTLVRRSQQ